MAFGKRIKFFRNRKGMKQKELGELLGFLGKTSDVRVDEAEIGFVENRFEGLHVAGKIGRASCRERV